MNFKHLASPVSSRLVPASSYARVRVVLVLSLWLPCRVLSRNAPPLSGRSLVVARSMPGPRPSTGCVEPCATHGDYAATVALARSQAGRQDPSSPPRHLACLPPFKAWSATTTPFAATSNLLELIAMANPRLRFPPTLERNPTNLPHFDTPYTGFQQNGSTSLVPDLKRLIDETSTALSATAIRLSHASESDEHGVAATPSEVALARSIFYKVEEAFDAALATIEVRTKAHFAFRIKRRNEEPRGTL
jgi:hypothetical protein